jgi:hypothetical protein
MFALGLGGWSEITATRPSARAAMGLVWASHASATVLFGGMTGQTVANGDTWSWSGGAWTKLAPATAPSARGRVSMVYDSHRQVVVLFGGFNGSAYLDQTWEFVL